MVWCVRRHGNEMHLLQQAALLELVADLIAPMEWRVIPDDADPLVRMPLQELFERLENLTGFLPVHFVQLAAVRFLIQEANVALEVSLPVHLDDGAFALLQPRTANDGFLLQPDLVASEHLPAVIGHERRKFGLDGLHPRSNERVVPSAVKGIGILEAEVT